MSAVCRSCGAPVTWVAMGTVDGKRNPLDRGSRPDGNVELTGIIGPDGTPVAKVATRASIAAEPYKKRYVSHFTTCPEAGKWRKR